LALLLSFDTATRHLAVVVSDDDRPLASRTDRSEQLSHAEKLNVFIDEVLREAQVEASQLQAIAVGIGPGSYTGLRIGLSAAKGLAFGLNTRLIGMSTLDVLAAEAQAGGRIFGPDDRPFPMVDARRMEVFTQPFTPDGRSVSGTKVEAVVLDEAWCSAQLAQAERVIVFGDGADKAAVLWNKDAVKERVIHIPDVKPDVRGLAACAARYWNEKAFADLAYLVPAYGKAPVIKAPNR
jgi:tRNA threonylcarbamoyladenosine biosynthesis protein TsaB